MGGGLGPFSPLNYIKKYVVADALHTGRLHEPLERMENFYFLENDNCLHFRPMKVPPGRSLQYVFETGP